MAKNASSGMGKPNPFYIARTPGSVNQKSIDRIINPHASGLIQNQVSPLRVANNPFSDTEESFPFFGLPSTLLMALSLSKGSSPDRAVQFLFRARLRIPTEKKRKVEEICEIR